MSGPVASAGVSKFQAFMNHPAGMPPSLSMRSADGFQALSLLLLSSEALFMA